jgi:hypothetical protein
MALTWLVYSRAAAKVGRRWGAQPAVPAAPRNELALMLHPGPTQLFATETHLGAASAMIGRKSSSLDGLRRVAKTGTC